MTQEGIEREIRQNRRDTRRLSGFFSEARQQRQSALQFRPLEVRVDVTATVETRALADTLVVGHPDPEHGVGRGGVGDNRGAWIQQASTSTSALLEDGRAAIADALTQAARGVDQLVTGSGTGDSDPTDDGLEAPAVAVAGWGAQPDAQTVTGTAVFGFDQAADPVVEVLLEDNEGAPVARATVDAVDRTLSEEVRVEIELAFGAGATPGGAITDWSTIAGAIKSPAETIGLAELALGTDGTAPSTLDTGLGAEVIRKGVGHATGGNGVQAVATVFQGEPTSQPHDLQELGVFDQDGTLLWRLSFGAETKDDDRRLRPASGIRVI